MPRIPVNLLCHNCERAFQLARWKRDKEARRGQKHFYCSRKCFLSFHSRHQRITNGFKLCARCKQDKPVSSFYRAKTFSGLDYSCKACTWETTKKARAKQPLEERRKRRRLWYWKLREEVLRLYGHACECCGESNLKFLTFDHPLNDGKAARHYSKNLLRLRRDRPQNIRILCWNCNSGRQMNGGICPHNAEEETILFLPQDLKQIEVLH